MIVPFFNGQTEFTSDSEVIKHCVFESGESQQFILKDSVAAWEQAVVTDTGARFAIAVGNATEGIQIALLAAQLEPGEVLAPAFTNPAVANSILAAGLRPRFVDVGENRCTVDVDEVKRRINPNTRAVLPAHLWSSLVDMPGITEVARLAGISVIEDAAVMYGARIGDVPVGLWGDAGVFSFFSTKPLGGIGDAGVIVTDSEDIATRCRWLRNHGQDGKHRFVHHLLGLNSRMDEHAARYLLHRRGSYPRLRRKREEIARHYDARFLDVAPSLHLFSPPDKHFGIHHKYVVRTTRKTALQDFLKTRGIETEDFSGYVLPHQAAFAEFAAGERFPNAEELQRDALALPLYPSMTDLEIEHVAESVVAFFRDK